MENITDFEAAFRRGMAAEGLKTVMIGGIEHAMIPEGCSVQNFSKLMDRPNRIRAAHQFHDIDSYSRYFKEFCGREESSIHCSI
ncbi:MAG: DUF2303 family protein [Gammaproteobacteria bacterium]|nr:DUF2303 family protein [Gammaproteobacteria bacterium]